MKDYAWSHRPLLIYAESPGSAELNLQREYYLGRQSELDDRDMVVIEIIGDMITVDGEPYVADVDGLKKRYGLDPSQPFAVLLIGKDTGVKLRQTRPVTAEELFGLIDSMPMRQREMREASG